MGEVVKREIPFLASFYACMGRNEGPSLKETTQNATSCNLDETSCSWKWSQWISIIDVREGNELYN